MQCKKCGFLVSQNFKYALIKNFCPQCGEKLLSEKDMNYLSLLQSKILKNSFAKNFTEHMAYDLALYVYDEIVNGLGSTIVQEKLLMQVTKEAADLTPLNEDLKEYKTRIREEEAARVLSESMETLPGVDATYEEDIDEYKDEYPEDEDVDDKVKRLKNLHKQIMPGVKAKPIRRIE